MKERGWVRYFVFLVFFLILFIELINLASSTITIGSPIAFGNYSTTMNISITSADPHLNSSEISYNVTLYCNKSGGSVEVRRTADIVATIWNATENAVFFENAATSISSLTDALRLYNCTAYADNSTNADAGNWSVSVRNITIDNTPPNVSFTQQTNTINNGNYSGTITLNVSVNDSVMGVDSVYFNITNSSGIQVNWTRAINSSNYYNITLDTTAFADGKYNVTVYANDTQLNNLNKTERIQITIDNTAPTLTFSCSPSTVNIGYPVTCSCSGSAASGVLTTTYTASPSTATAGTFTETCNVTNYVGNSTTATATYAVSYSGGNINTGGGGGVSKTDTNSWTKITPGVAVIMKDFDKDIGVKQIQIEVNNVAQNVQIIVNKYNSKPANVTVEKSSTYQYLSVMTRNLLNNLSRAIIESQVNKSWVLSRNFNKTDIALFKYDESSNKWNELPTTFKEEDSNYYYYDTLVTSFSYFAIAPKEKPATTTTGEPETQLEEEQEAPWTLSTWIWGAIVLVVVAGGIVLFFLLKKKRRKVK